MRNVFMAYMPIGNHEAMVHYEDTIKNRVPLERIAPHVDRGLLQRLRTIFESGTVAVWGSRHGPQNQARFDRMKSGDYLVIVEGGHIKAIGHIAAKLISPRLSRELWKPLTGDSSDPWSLIYFIANVRELDVPFEKFSELFGYSENYRLRGFSSVAATELEAFYRKYDDLYSVLVRIQHNQPIQTWDEAPVEPLSSQVDELVELDAEQVDEALCQQLVSEHVRMQFKLARLGIKAGEKVWVPAGDKEKLRRSFQFDSFDKEFSSGLDLPRTYVENIDVVWRQEFRIAAAYEIENSTAIYSGLLRFSDLMVVAPNTIYPMFVVAPAERRNQVRKQLDRPTFRDMKLASKVRFLSYETIDEVDRFFEEADSGLSVDVIEGRAEVLG